MSLSPRSWAVGYRALHPVSLAVQLGALVLLELALFASYDVHDARFHWATHFLVALAVTSLLQLLRLLLTGAPGPRFLLLSLAGWHLFAMLPDLLFRAGQPHAQWMNVFLGHVVAHSLPGGDTSWLVIALSVSAAYVACLTAWLRARTTEAALGMPPGVGLTGMAVLRPQRDPRASELVHEEYGEGTPGSPIVLLHGLGASAAFWRPVVGQLQGRPCLVPDLLGFARSIRLGTHFHLDDQAAAVLRLIDRHGGGPVVLVAHSYGAAVAVEVALERPDLVARMVLVSPAAFADAAQARERLGGPAWLTRRALEESAVADVACGLMCLLRRPVTRLAPRLARRSGRELPDEVVRDAVTYVWPAFRDGLSSLLADRSLSRWLAAPPIPTTVVVAEQDRTVPADTLTALLGPDVETVVLPGSHALPLERPQEVAAVIARALPDGHADLVQTGRP